MSRKWTPEAARALGVRTDLVTACDLVYGAGKNTAYEMYHAGRLDFPVIRCGRRLIVPVAPLLQLLGIAPDNSDAGPAEGPAAAATDPAARQTIEATDDNRAPAARATVSYLGRG